jgi:putative hydrolase of the HAD superfamily
MSDSHEIPEMPEIATGPEALPVQAIQATIRRHCRPLVPIATGERPVLRPLDGVRAVLFDIYGTLFISTSGDLGAGSTAAKRGRAFEAALRAADLPADCDGEQGVDRLYAAIRGEHDRNRARGVEYPEVDIVEMWRRALSGLVPPDRLRSAAGRVTLEKVALEYEMRTNPVWPMPHLRECLDFLRQQGFVLGLVSNAQFFTSQLFPALLGAPAGALGFDGHLSCYSYRHGHAKPGLLLYRVAGELLAGRGIQAREVLHVGNDMLKDIRPASALGFRTALYAGDARSLRRREDDPRVRDVVPDLVLTDLLSLKRCLSK